MSRYQIVNHDGIFFGLRDGQCLIVGDATMERCKASLRRIIRSDWPMRKIKWAAPLEKTYVQGGVVVQQTEVR